MDFGYHFRQRKSNPRFTPIHPDMPLPHVRARFVVFHRSKIGEARMPTGVQIDATRFYDSTIFDALEIGQGTIRRAQREGALRFVRKGQRPIYLGQWILDWLNADANSPR